MDSMRSLNRSLPSSQPSRLAPPEQLLQAFRTAALSVTNLYKSAAADQSNTRQAGYQDALEDLLQFLDKENLGLQDGEGWRVRQWATERYDGGTSLQHEENEEENVENEQRNRTVSPVNEQSATEVPQPPRSQEPQQPDHVNSDDGTSESSERTPVFQFTAGNNSGADHLMQTDDSRSTNDRSQPSSSSSSAPIRIEASSRVARNTQRHLDGRGGFRPSRREFTFNNGTKRKLQFPDFFDISNMNPDQKDGFGGGGNGGTGGGSNKKGRIV